MRSKQPKVLLMLLGGLGDVLQFTPALGVMRRAWPRSRIDAVVRSPAAARVLRGNPHVNEVMVYRQGQGRRLWQRLKLLGWIWQQRYDTSVTHAVDFDYKTGLFTLLSGIPRRVGPAVRAHGLFYNTRLPMEAGVHQIDRNLALVAAAGARGEVADDFRFFVDASETAFAAEFLDRNRISARVGFIAIHPGGGPWRTVRRWPAEGYITLMDQLARCREEPLVLFGGPDEREVADTILRAADSRVIPAPHPMTLGQFAALAAQSRLFVCNDGGPLLVAAAMGAATLTLVGPTDPKSFAPRGARHGVVMATAQCRPCIDYYDYASDGCPPHTCMKDLTPQMVFAAVLAHLDNPTPSRPAGGTPVASPAKPPDGPHADGAWEGLSDTEYHPQKGRRR